jgi:multiple sugar transport system substrate-binding protein
MRTVPRWSTPLAAGTLLLAGCGGVGGGSETEGGSGASPGEGEVSGAITTSGFGLGDEIATVRTERFEADHPEVTLTVNDGAFDAQQFLSAVASGNPPDVVYMDREVLGTYAARGAITPLEDCVEQAGIALEDFREPAVEQVTLDGTLYGIPEFFSVRVLLVNGPAVAEAGADPQAVSTADWDALAELNTELTRGEGGNLARIGVDPKLPEFLPLWAAANGAQLVSEDGRTAQLDSPEVVAALDYGVGLIEEAGGWGPFKAFRDGWDFFGARNQFVEDQLGVMPMEDWYLNVLAEVSPDAEVVVRPFETREGEPVTFATGSAWAIPEGAANPEAACEFVATMTAQETWVEAATARAEARAEEGLPFTGTYTGNRAADEQIFAEVWKPSGNERLDEGVQTVLDLQDAAFTTPASPAAAEIEEAWTGAVNRVLTGDASAAEALRAAQTEAQAALDEAGGS